MGARRGATIQPMARKRPLSAFLGFLGVSILAGVQVARVDAWKNLIVTEGK